MFTQNLTPGALISSPFFHCLSNWVLSFCLIHVHISPQHLARCLNNTTRSSPCIPLPQLLPLLPWLNCFQILNCIFYDLQEVVYALASLRHILPASLSPLYWISLVNLSSLRLKLNFLCELSSQSEGESSCSCTAPKLALEHPVTAHITLHFILLLTSLHAPPE